MEHQVGVPSERGERPGCGEVDTHTCASGPGSVCEGRQGSTISSPTPAHCACPCACKAWPTTGAGCSLRRFVFQVAALLPWYPAWYIVESAADARTEASVVHRLLSLFISQAVNIDNVSSG